MDKIKIDIPNVLSEFKKSITNGNLSKSSSEPVEDVDIGNINNETKIEQTNTSNTQIDLTNIDKGYNIENTDLKTYQASLEQELELYQAMLEDTENELGILKEDAFAESGTNLTVIENMCKDYENTITSEIYQLIERYKISCPEEELEKLGLNQADVTSMTYAELFEVLKEKDDEVKEKLASIEEYRKENLDKAISENTEFSTYDEYLARIEELEVQQTTLNTSIYKIEQLKKMAKYEFLVKEEDYQNFNYECQIDKSVIEEMRMQMGTQVSYSEYCTKTGDNISPLEFCMWVQENYPDTTATAMDNEGLLKTLISVADEDSDLIKTYNYLYEKEGIDSANKYLEDIEDQINQLAGQKKAEKFLEGLKKDENGNYDYTDIMNHFKVSGKGIGDGAQNFFLGLAAWHQSSDVYSVEEYESLYILEALSDDKDFANFLDNNYEISMSVGNMLPSIALGMLTTPTAGTFLMGTSAGGNSYHQALVNGVSTRDAVFYGTLSGLSEATLQKWIGSIPGLNDVNVTSFKELATSILKEGGEEGAQEYIDAYLRGTVLGEQLDGDQLNLDALKSTIYGMIISGTMNGPSLTANKLSNVESISDTNISENQDVIETTNDIVDSISSINTSILQENINNRVADKVSKSIKGINIPGISAISKIIKGVSIGKEQVPISREIDEIHGYQLNENDITGFYKSRLESGFFTKEQLDSMIENINNKGYISEETGEYISNLFADPNYDVYIKTIPSSDIASISEIGLYCNNHTASGGGAPTSIDEINIDATITRMDSIIDAIRDVKNANGISQGSNIVDGAIFLKIPKGLQIEDLVYFNEEKNVYCIKPEYIDSFFSVDKDGVVSDVNKINSSGNTNTRETIDEVVNSVAEATNTGIDSIRDSSNDGVEITEKLHDIDEGSEITEKLTNIDDGSSITAKLTSSIEQSIDASVKVFQDKYDIANYFNDANQFLLNQLEIIANTTNNQEVKKAYDKMSNESIRDIDYKDYLKYLPRKDKKTYKKLQLLDKIGNSYTETEKDLIQTYTLAAGPAVTAYLRHTITNFKGRFFNGKKKSSINEYLTKSINFTGKFNELFKYTNVDEYVQAMDNIIEKSEPLKDDILVYRGVDALYLDGNRINTFNIGQKFNDQAFMSTSLIPKKISSTRHISLEIEVPKGTKAAYLEKFAGIKNYNQQELLLGRNNEFEIISYPKIDQNTGQIKIRARLIPQEESIVSSLNLDKINSKNQSLSYYNNFVSKSSPLAQNQIDLYDIMNTFKEKGLLGRFESEVRYLKSNDLYDINIPEHNIDHVERVLFYSMYMGEELGLSSDQMNILIEAAKFHDSGRVNLQTDTNHAELSAVKALKELENNYSEEELNKIAAVIEYHEAGDTNADINRIFSKYNISNSDANDVYKIATILKDADALDRVRFPGNLNEKYLRNELATELIKSSYQIQEIRGNKEIKDNMLEQKYTKEQLDNIVELKKLGISDHLINFYNKYNTRNVYNIIRNIIVNGGNNG